MTALGSESSDGDPNGIVAKPDVICVQEHKRFTHAINETKSKLRVLGYHGVVGNAYTGIGGGVGGGTAVIGRTHIPFSPVEAVEDCNHKLAALPGSDTGRASAAIFRGGPLKSMLVVSTYLHSGEGLSDRNLELLHRICVWLRAYGQPYVWGGDFNMSPITLAESGVLGTAQGCIISTGTNTMHGCQNENDYWVVSHQLAPFVRSVAVRSTSLTPRKVVRLVLGPVPSADHYWRIVRPGKLEVELDKDHPAVPDDLEYDKVVAEAAGAADEQDILNCTRKFFHNAVREILVVRGLTSSEGKAHLRGNATPHIVHASRVCLKPDVEPRGPARHEVWRRLRNDLRELAGLAKTFEKDAREAGVQGDATTEQLVNAMTRQGIHSVFVTIKRLERWKNITNKWRKNKAFLLMESHEKWLQLYLDSIDGVQGPYGQAPNANDEPTARDGPYPHRFRQAETIKARMIEVEHRINKYSQEAARERWKETKRWLREIA